MAEYQLQQTGLQVQTAIDNALAAPSQIAQKANAADVYTKTEIDAQVGSKADKNGSSAEDFNAATIRAFTIQAESNIVGAAVTGETVAGDKVTVHNDDNNATTDLVPGGQSQDIEVTLPSKNGTLALQEDVYDKTTSDGRFAKKSGDSQQNFTAKGLVAESVQTESLEITDYSTDAQILQNPNQVEQGARYTLPADDGTLITEETVDEKLLRKANVDGTYESMSVGTAQNLSGRKEVTDSFFARPTGGEDAEVANGLAQIVAVGGNSVKFNQLLQNGNFANGTTGWTGITSLDGGIATMQETATGSNLSKNLNHQVTYVHGHTYIFLVLAKSNNAGTRISIIPTGTGSQGMTPSTYFQDWTVVPFIWTRTGTSVVANLQIRGNNNADPSLDVDFSVKSVMCTDLTDIFGSGNEPATVEEFEAWLADTVGLSAYYAQMENSVVNVNMLGQKSTGRNLLDPTTGTAEIIGAYSDVYGNYYGITGTHGTLVFVNWAGESEVITPDADGKFLIEEPGTLFVGDAGDDCAVFLWWDGTKTDFVEHEANTVYLDIPHIYGKKNGADSLVRVWPTGAPGFNGLQDMLKVVDGETVAERVIGEVDLGTLNYSLISDAFSAGIKNKRIVSGAGGSNLLCSKYVAADRAAYIYMADKTIMETAGSTPGVRIGVKDTAYSTADDFKTAMNGVPLYFELATPEVYTDLVYMGSDHFEDGTPVTLPVKTVVDNWGVEQILPVNDGAVLTAKPTITSMYSIDAVELLNTHSDEIGDIYEKIDEKPDAVGTYPGMSVGSADTLNGDTAQHAEYTERKTGYPNTVASGPAKITRVYGNSIVWNQLVQNGDFSDGTTGWSNENATMSVSGGVLSFTATAKYGRIRTAALNGIIAGHKYIVFAWIASDDVCHIQIRNNSQATAFLDQETTNGRKGYLFTAGGVNVGDSVVIRILDYADSDWQPVSVDNVFLVDLTLMFGATAAAAMTVEQFERLYNLPYFANNAGAIKNNAATAIEYTGFNQWNEEWESGRYSSGVKTAAASHFRCKNKIRVFPSLNYYVKGEALFVQEYDANGNYLRERSGSSGLTNNIITISSDARYITFWAYGQTTYNHDICINISNPSRNGTYEPYKRSELVLNIPTLTGKLNGEGESVLIYPSGMRSAGSAQDYLIVDADGYARTAVKVVGELDLGDYTWGYNTSNERFASPIIPAIKAPASAWGDNGICERYQVRLWGSNSDKFVTIGQNSRLYLKDTAFGSDGDALRASLVGVKMLIELATPEVYTLDEPIYCGYSVDGDGVERRLPVDTADSVLAPFSCDVIYAIDAVGTLKKLPENYISKESMQAYLTARAAIDNGIWTMTWNATTGKYDFTFTPNGE